jgi:tetratricopeptide (TPR) repeat protein
MKQIRTWFLIPTIFVGMLAVCLLPDTVAAERCEEWPLKVVSVQGSVQVRKSGETEWITVKLNDVYCPGDMIRVQERSRAAIVLPNETMLRLDQLTTITFSGVERERALLLDVLTGAAHFFSRIPRALKVGTAFVNATVEGTEFFVRVEPDQTFLSIFEGRVAATNAAGSLTLASGQSAIAREGQAPTPRVVARPRDAVQWALYYPAIVHYRPADFPETGWQAMVRESIEFYWQGDLARAFSSLEGAPEDIHDPRFFTYRAALLLSVGRVDEASVDIERALNLDPSNSHAFALQSIIAVVQNKKDEALDLARKAVDLDPQSSAARVALSYAQQAHFEIEQALASLQEAVKLDPENALAWARLAELWLSIGYLDKALEVARQAVSLNPNLARTQTVLGFAYLTQIKTQDSKKAFEKAIELDPAAPLPRLGLGLAKIREGDLKEGRGEIEIAASLDPNNALIRSYLGKAYFEEKRDKPAIDELAIAKELDPLDPTPWFYDAIRKQTVNRPVEALQDLQKSIELNDNRAVYRSRLLLDEDLAARSAALGRIYNNLGFQQLALVEGWKSLNTDPSNYSAHRFLADSYAALPRHEIARVSELLQSQLLQPINITPIQPQLAETSLFILEGAGPSDPSFNEFNPLFNRNRLALQANGVVGGNETRGNDLVFSGLQGKASYSIGQFHYETDGFRVNNDQERDIYNLFAQVNPWYKTSLLAEFRATDSKYGDLPLRFDPQLFFPNDRNQEETKSTRLGMRHSFSPKSDLIATVIFKDIDAKLENAPAQFEYKSEEDGYMPEVQHLFRLEWLSFVSGLGYSRSDRKATYIWPPWPPVLSEKLVEHTNLYLYSQINIPKDVTWTLGASAQRFKGILDKDRFNPKVGITWNLFPSTTLRAAAFRVLSRNMISNQTIEPTQVAGFNQFFYDAEAVEAWRYGAAIDQRFREDLFGGLELSKRDLDTPYPTFTGEIDEVKWHEEFSRAYLYWTPYKWLSANVEYQRERFERDLECTGEELIHILETHKLPMAVNVYCPFGITTTLKATYVDQEGEFDPNPGSFVTEKESDHFWVLDASVSYRLPRRYGLISVEAKNLLDEEFQFQTMEKAYPEIVPERLILAKITLSF